MEHLRWPRLVYASVTATLGPVLLPPLLLLRRVRGLEPVHWRERLGHASLPRPAGSLVWFHAVSVGEGMSAIPIIYRCLQERPTVHILMTTSTSTAFSVLQNLLPINVLCQFAPFDTPSAVTQFLKHWKPQAAIFMENEIWPNMLLAAAEQGVALALLNARMSLKSYTRWSLPPAKVLVASVLSKFSLVAPLNTKEAVQFQILGAPPGIIHFAGNLKYACSTVKIAHWEASREALVSQMRHRRVWLAASTHRGEEEVALKIHKHLRTKFPDVLTLIAPRHPDCASAVVKKLKKDGVSVAQRSKRDQITADTEVYVADTVGELSIIYGSVPIAFVGGSLFQGLSGHNFAEAAAAGCAVLTGPHVGHFSEMVQEMQRLEPNSVEQVSGEHALLQAVEVLMHDNELLSVRRAAAKRAVTVPATTVVSRVWKVLDTLILSKFLPMNTQ